MSDGMGRELAYLSSHATNRYFIPNWGILFRSKHTKNVILEQKECLMFYIYMKILYLCMKFI